MDRQKGYNIKMTVSAYKLEDAGFDRKQVEALTDFMVGTVATKEDIAHLEGKIISLDGKIEILGAGLKGEINTLKWMFGVLIAVNIGIAIKLLFA